MQFTQKDGLSIHSVWCMLEDRTGNIWFGTDDGLSRYDGMTISRMSFTQSFSMGLGAPAAHQGRSRVLSIFEDKSGNIWFGGRGLGNFLYNGKTFVNFTEKPGIGNPVLVDKAGNIWFNGGIWS